MESLFSTVSKYNRVISEKRIIYSDIDLEILQYNTVLFLNIKLNILIILKKMLLPMKKIHNLFALQLNYNPHKSKLILNNSSRS